MWAEKNLPLDRCPHCSIAQPNLVHRGAFETSDQTGLIKGSWRVFECASCGNMVLAQILKGSELPFVTKVWPEAETVDGAIPDKPRNLLQQAIESIAQPSGAIMLCASSVDAMLKDKGYSEGKLYSRIKEAATDNLITEEMKIWAHEVRLNANDERHADDDAAPALSEDAKRSISFTKALGEFLFVLPARVTAGRGGGESIEQIFNEAGEKANRTAGLGPPSFRR